MRRRTVSTWRRYAGLVAPGCQVGGARQPGREPGRLLLVEIGGGAAEVVPGGGLGAPHARAEFYDVQVQLEDARLAERPLELPGEDRLLDLAQRVARRRQPEILGQLLRDGGRAARHLALVDRRADRLADLAEVEAVCEKKLMSSATSTARLRCGEIRA